MTREERSDLGKLKSSDNVFRIQDKGSRFVIVSQNEYKDKMLGQLSNDLHYNKLDHDPTSEHYYSATKRCYFDSISSGKSAFKKMHHLSFRALANDVNSTES